MINDIIISGTLGLIGGFLSGFTGLTTTSIILAGLSISHVITDYKTILGTLLYVIAFPISIGSVWQFYKEKKINYFIGNIILVTMIIGSYFGTKVILTKKLNITPKTIKYISAFIAFFAGIYFLIEAYYT